MCIKQESFHEYDNGNQITIYINKGMFIIKSRWILALNPVNRDEKFQYNLVIWGEFYEVVYRVGRQISNHHRVHFEDIETKNSIK